MNLVDELHAIAAALEGAGITYAVCGGVAVSIHGHVRATKDIDILIAREDVERALEGPLSVVSKTTLIRLKRLAGRAQDLADIERLESPDAG